MTSASLTFFLKFRVRPLIFVSFFSDVFAQIAALQARLRAAEEETGSTRREALLEGRAKSLVEVTAAIKQVAEACAEAEVLRERCNQQVRADMNQEVHVYVKYYFSISGIGQGC